MAVTLQIFDQRQDALIFVAKELKRRPPEHVVMRGPTNMIAIQRSAEVSIVPSDASDPGYLPPEGGSLYVVMISE
jgi:hypothetical protein